MVGPNLASRGLSFLCWVSISQYYFPAMSVFIISMTSRSTATGGFPRMQQCLNTKKVSQSLLTSLPISSCQHIASLTVIHLTYMHLQEIQQMPYWLRRNGTDHLLVSVSDFGGCDLEDGTLENATVIQHFGKVLGKDMGILGQDSRCDPYERWTDACDPVSNAARLDIALLLPAWLPPVFHCLIPKSAVLFASILEAS